MRREEDVRGTRLTSNTNPCGLNRHIASSFGNRWLAELWASSQNSLNNLEIYFVKGSHEGDAGLDCRMRLSAPAAAKVALFTAFETHAEMASDEEAEAFT